MMQLGCCLWDHDFTVSVHLLPNYLRWKSDTWEELQVNGRQDGVGYSLRLESRAPPTEIGGGWLIFKLFC